LLNNEEKSTIGIIRMLNCGQNTAFDELHKIFNDTPKEVALLHQIIVQDKSEAIKTLKDAGLTTEQIASVIKYTHCDARPDYYITSSDMIGKAGVWGHFGSWDFNKAVMYQQTKDKTQEEAVAYLTKKFNFTAEQATQLHSQIQSTPADSWIAPWPNYISGINPCETSSEKELLCNVGTSQGTITLSVNLENKSAIVKTNNPETVVHPDSLVYADKEGIKEKKFSSENNQQILGFSAVLIPQGESGGVTTYGMMLTDPALGASTFTKLYFFNGHGMKCFSKFDDVNSATGGMVATWKVDYECKQKNQVFFLPKEEVQAAHLLITLNNRTEEAKALIDKIKAEITTQNFAEYAKKYSEDPGSKNYGGELGWFGKGIMVPEFEKAAFAVNSGEISQPIKSQFGWHLIWVKEKRTS
ncbi:MAG: peptidylprolyl isomerase, partial [Nanoarchaeota archaeon]